MNVVGRVLMWRHIRAADLPALRVVVPEGRREDGENPSRTRRCKEPVGT